MAAPYFYVYKDVRKEWRWRFVAGNGNIIAVASESYKNLVDCESALELVKSKASSASITGDDSYKKLRR